MGDMSAERDVLAAEDCWELLRSREFARLAYVLDGAPSIVPLNYVVDGDQLVFRTAHGRKLHAILHDARVAVEVDQINDGDEVGLSVVVHGHACVLPAGDELRLEQVGLRPWLRSEKPVLVAVRPHEVIGRRYRLARPWRRMIR